MKTATLAFVTITVDRPALGAQAEFRVVVDVRGPAAWGQRQVSRSVRRTLADEIGELHSSVEFRRTQKELGIPERRQTYPSALARAARSVGADYIVFVRVAKPKREGALGYVARAYLIASARREIVHRIQVPYRTLASASGVGAQVALSVADALRRQPALSVADALRRPPAPTGPAPAPPARARTDEGTAAARPPRPEPPPTAPPSPVPPVDLRRAARPSPPDPATAPVRGDERTTALAATEVEPAPPDPATAPVRGDERTTALAATEVEPSTMLRLGLGVGSGLYRDYALSSAAGESTLSYDLPPVFLVGVAAEIDVPSTALGVTLAATLRTAGFEVTTDGETTNPGGLLIDGRFLLDYGFRLAGAFVLRPQAGLRLSVIDVDAQPAVLSSTALAPVVGARAELGGPAGLQGLVGFDVGYFVLYDERPARTGDATGGLALGVDLGARYWLSDGWALTVDGRATFDRVGFSGAPTRAVQRSEAARFSDASLLILDASTRVGVLWRL